MVASGHFQDSIEPPSAFDVEVLIQDKALGKAMLQLTGNAEVQSPFLLVLGASG